MTISIKNATRAGRGVAIAAAFAAVVLHAAPARAETWAIDATAGDGVSPTTRDTFRQLLADELASRNRAAFVTLDGECRDASCTRDAAARAGATIGVHVVLSTLGNRILVGVTILDVGPGVARQRLRMSVDRIEELEAVAARIAEATVSGKSVEDATELGNITTSEARPPTRRHGTGGLSLRAVGLAPMGNAFGNGAFGVGVDVGYWYEAPSFAIEPKIGFRFAPAGRQGSSYQEVPIGITFHYLFSNSDLAPFVGLGGGIDYIHERRDVKITLGQMLTAKSTAVLDDATLGFNATGRLGVLLFRTYTTRMTAAVDYSFTFAKLNGQSNPQAIVFGLGVVL